jgi:hypothetical protein
MRLIKLIALAFISIFAMTSVQAASLVMPSGKTSVGSAVEQIAAKKDDKKPAPKKSKKKGKASKAGKCGTNMYWDKKAKKCADAREKK